MFARTISVCTAALACLLFSGTLLAGTTTYKGSGLYKVTRMLLPMANGDAVLNITNSVIASIEPGKTGFISGDCSGLGYLKAGAGSYTVDIYCTFQESEEDGFDVHAKVVDQGGDVRIIGGSGKWKGATGTGTVTRRHTDIGGGTYDYEFKITTP